MTKKGLDLLERQQDEIIDGLPTGNVYVGLTPEELEELKKELETLEIIKSLHFVLEFNTSLNEWTLYICNEELCMVVAKGTDLKTYALLREVLL